MNRLILIGNGFDLAHGLKTSYKDFIFWYLDECLNKAGIYANGHFYEDDFVKVVVTEHYRLMELASKVGDMGISRYLYEKGLLAKYMCFFSESGCNEGRIKDEYGEVDKIVAHKIDFNSLFFKKLIDTCLECGWVDIEQEYFKDLKSYRDTDNRFNYTKVNTVNRDLAYLKAKLEEYLSLQDAQFDNRQNFQLAKLLGQGFEENDFDPGLSDDELRIKLWKDSTDDKSKNIQHKAYVLNFNYTNTFRHYIDEIRRNGKFDTVEENHIHGQLNTPNNPIIFGFGDEHDKEYLLFEEHNNNSLFEHVKSYHYMKTPNYRNLIRFLNEDFYQVLVVGHSCGLSDRTMFKEIFDHDNCKSVKIFHHKRSDGSTDFFDKTINLGRHFSDKGSLRKLIVNFNEADAIPQFEK